MKYFLILLGLFFCYFNNIDSETYYNTILKQDIAKDVMLWQKNNIFFFVGGILFILSGVLFYIEKKAKKYIWNKKNNNNVFENIHTVREMRRLLNPTTFEEYITYIYKKKGYKAERVGFGSNCKKEKRDGIYGDGGKDVLLKSKLPFGKDTIIQCKFYDFKNYVNVKTVREMYAILMHYKAKKVIIITTSTFSTDARLFAKGKKIELIDGKKLEKLIKQH